MKLKAGFCPICDELVRVYTDDSSCECPDCGHHIAVAEVDEDDIIEDWDDYDHCYECGGYGDDYFINEDGELESSCPTCPFNRNRYDDDEEA